MIHLLSFLFVFVSSVGYGSTTLYHGGKIYLFDQDKTVANWMVVSNGKVTQWGKGKRLPKATQKVHLKNQIIIPGLTDNHVNLADIGKELFQVNLKGARSPEEVTDRIVRYLKIRPELKGQTIVGNGWDQADWPSKRFPYRQMLDKVSNAQPIILYRIDGLAAWVNTYALKKSGLWNLKSDPMGGRILRDRHNLPTGVVLDNASRALLPLIPPASADQLAQHIQLAVRRAQSLGITSIHDAGATRQQIVAIDRLLRQKKVLFRFYEMISSRYTDDLDHFLKRGPQIGINNGKLTVRTIKVFLDGAMGSRGAAFEEPYRDDPTTRGVLKMTEPELIEKIKRFDKHGFQISIHAIGSRANHMALNAIEKALGEKAAEKRPRIEHAQVLNEADVPRFGQLGVIASMQPAQCTSDMKWVAARIGKKRARYSYAWNSLLKTKATLAFGSDAPVESLNPWEGIFAAVTRQTSDFLPTDGFIPEERINRWQALFAFTRGPAYASFSETTLGNLNKGNWADFVVLNKDPFQVSLQELRELEVQATYIGGELVYRAPSPAT